MEYRIVDLHCHSTASDGTVRAEDLALLAKDAGLSALALTDHDTLDGLAAFQKAGEKIGLETIPGIEFAAWVNQPQGVEIHIVGLGFDPAAPIWREVINTIVSSREERNLAMIQRAKQLGLDLSLEDVANEAGGKIITRAHYANVLRKKGYVRTKEEACAKYLGAQGAIYVPRKYMSPASAISTIHETGGAAILAHPTLYGLNLAQLEEMLEKELLPYGLDGMECKYSTYTVPEEKSMTALAEKYHLLPSGGSDFHGANKPDIALGRGFGSLRIPYAFWENLKARTSFKQ